jgi:NarL family two-component system sensor histidine kinase LiaS
MWYHSNLLARLMNSSPNSERTRLARELHDGLAQELASLGYRLDQIIGSNNLDNVNRAPLRQIRFSISGLINQVRDEIFELRTNESKSFKAQLDQQLSTILSLSDITYEIHGEIEVKSNQRFELMRAVRELIFNAMRHADCSVIQISLTNNQIEIEDNGVGGVIEKQNSYGLLGVRERLAEIGALIDIKSESTGSTILISL